jgi:hypothetical protein
VACPDGQPEGWGTVTPDTYWMMQCGNCAQSPTGTADPLTPTVAATPTPEPTATQTSGVFFKSIYYHQQFIIDVVDSTDYVNWVGYPGVALPPLLYCGPDAEIRGALVWVQVNGYSGAAKLRPFGSATFGAAEGNLGFYSYVGTYPQNTINHNDMQNLSGHTLNKLGSTNQINYKTIWPWPSGFVDVRRDSTLSADFVYYGVLCYGIPEPEATPIPTAMSYCNQVDDGLGAADLGISLPEIVVSQAYCLQIGGQSLDLSVLNLIPGIDDVGEIGVPGFYLCYQYISFGHLDLFGLNVDLDILAMLMGGIALLRILLRS